MLQIAKNPIAHIAHALFCDGGSSSMNQLSTRANNKSLQAMFKVDTVVRVYETYDEAETAIRDLDAAGVDMKMLSIAAKDTHVMSRWPMALRSPSTKGR